MSDPTLLTLSNAAATVQLSRYGGQVLRYQVAGQPSLLWCNPPALLAAARQHGKPQRGGVPVCWPWFGAAPAGSDGPSHGVARTALWQVLDLQQGLSEAAVTLQYQTDGTDPRFPYAASATLEVRLTDRLSLTLSTHNRSDTPLPLTAGLHTYLQVGEVDRISVQGLAGSPRIDLVTGQRLPTLPQEARVQGETDWLCSQASSPLRLTDPVLRRQLEVGLVGTRQVVVWNPGLFKAATLDLEPGAWLNFVCLEAVITPRFTIPPGASAVLGTWVRALPLEALG